LIWECVLNYSGEENNQERVPFLEKSGGQEMGSYEGGCQSYHEDEGLRKK
jgi:hypothetical protein